MLKKESAASKRKLTAAAHHMAKSGERVAKGLAPLLNEFVLMREQLKAFGAYLDKRDDMIAARVEAHNTLSEAFYRLVDLLADNTTALKENTARLDAFLAQVETESNGGRGREYEN